MKSVYNTCIPKSNRFLITLCNYENLVGDKNSVLQTLKTFDVKYAILCEESSFVPINKHIHCYVEFKEPISYMDLRNLFSCFVHISSGIGTRQQNIEYCSKEDKEPLIYGGKLCKN